MDSAAIPEAERAIDLLEFVCDGFAWSFHRQKARIQLALIRSRLP
jgi:hypothetical protein